MLPLLLFNVISSLGVDKATDLATEHVESMIDDLLPEDAYLQCTGRLFISITVVSLTGFKNRLVSEFTSNQDLFEACLASSTIPFVSQKVHLLSTILCISFLSHM